MVFLHLIVFFSIQCFCSIGADPKEAGSAPRLIPLAKSHDDDDDDDYDGHEDNADQRLSVRWEGHLSPIEQLMSRLSNDCFFMASPESWLVARRTSTSTSQMISSEQWMQLPVVSLVLSSPPPQQQQQQKQPLNARYQTKAIPASSARLVCWTSVRTTRCWSRSLQLRLGVTRWRQGRDIDCVVRIRRQSWTREHGAIQCANKPLLNCYTLTTTTNQLFIPPTLPFRSRTKIKRRRPRRSNLSSGEHFSLYFTSTSD